MHIRGFCMVGALIAAAFVSGCDKRPSPAATTATGETHRPAIATWSDDTEALVRVHWLGKQRLASETNAAGFMTIWSSPESVALEAQTLDRLATAPWRLTRGDSATNGAPTTALRAILGDLLQSESHVELRGSGTNRVPHGVLAIKLEATRAAAWKTDLAQILESLSQRKTVATADGWTLDLSAAQPARISFKTAGGWTLIGIAPAENPLMSDFAARIQTEAAPFAPRTNNLWLEADLDLAQLEKIFDPDSVTATKLPRLHWQQTGDGENTRARANILFPAALPIGLTAWKLPTNLVVEPLLSFTAARGIGSVVSNAFGPWLGGVRAPEQFFSWGRSGPPLQMYAAAQADDALGLFGKLESAFISTFVPMIQSDKFGTITKNPAINKLLWDGLYFGVPSLAVVTNGGTEYTMLAFAPFRPAKSNALPDAISHRICEQSNLVYFNWEQTGERLGQWRYFDDSTRIIFDAAHRPRMNRYQPAIAWAAMGVTNLGHSVTEVHLVRSNELSFTRRSAAGLTALELNVLLNWLQLNEFPAGFGTIFTTNSTPAPVRRRPPGQGSSGIINIPATGGNAP